MTNRKLLIACLATLAALLLLTVVDRPAVLQAQTDSFPSGGGIESPASNAFAITPHDTNQLAYRTRGIICGTTGVIKVDMAGVGTAVSITVAAGVIHPLRIDAVYSTDTTATLCVGVY